MTLTRRFVSVSDPNEVQSTTSAFAYQPPTPTSLTESCSPDSSCSASSIVTPPSRSDPPVLPAILQRSPCSTLLYQSGQRRDPLQKSLDDVILSLKDKKCPVCKRQGCLLVSHKLYASRPKGRQPNPPSTDDEPPQAPFTISIGNARFDPFFNLPTGQSDPEMQQYLRDFFTAQGSSMTSPVRIRAFDSAYYPILLRQAFADPALCYTFFAMSATYSSVHGQCLDAPDARLLSIYGRTFRTLRQQISQNSQAKPSEATVMAAINLLMCHGIGFGDKQALTAHPRGLKNLVDARGGVSNLSGQLAALVLWADFYVTLFTGKKPDFLGQAGVMPDVPLSHPPAAMYGGGWHEPRIRGLAPPALLDVCHNTCRLIELLEDRVAGNNNPARWEYFLYKRNTMAMRNGIVHSKLYRSGTQAECISLAHNLCIFLVLRLMPWKAPIINLCDQLQVALLASGLHDYWAQDIGLLLWVLFMQLAGAEYWDGKQWALQLLVDTLSHHYGSEQRNWPPNWREMQRLNLMKFTWSELYLTSSFNATCQDLMTMTRSPTPVTVKQDASPCFESYAAPDPFFKKEGNSWGRSFSDTDRALHAEVNRAPANPPHCIYSNSTEHG
jgi:hypothetical protein